MDGFIRYRDMDALVTVGFSDKLPEQIKYGFVAGGNRMKLEDLTIEQVKFFKRVLGTVYEELNAVEQAQAKAEEIRSKLNL